VAKSATQQRINTSRNDAKAQRIILLLCVIASLREIMKVDTTEIDDDNLESVGEFMLNREQIDEVLKKCYDPEIPVNVLDLGLIYDVNWDEDRVNVKMTLTAPGCGMGPMIAEDVRTKLLGLPGVKEAKVEMVFDPPWTPEKMSEDAKKSLGWE
jgi:metal-sulfur cluster biosynthetic enzyme